MIENGGRKDTSIIHVMKQLGPMTGIRKLAFVMKRLGFNTRIRKKHLDKYIIRIL